MPRVYTQNRKRAISLTESLGVGGEGTVFAPSSDPSIVCKIYHERVLEERSAALNRKLTAMIDSPPEDPMLDAGTPTFAWPQELVFTDSNHTRFLGFIMPCIRHSFPLHKLYSAVDRKQLTFPTDSAGRPLPDYFVMTAAARNLAEAFRLLHTRGYVMADVNEDNIRFRTDATVSLIDNDSFQVRDRKSGEKFLVPVMKAEYWPVDSLDLHARGEALTPAHDQFGLAIFLFRLLMNGVHPFHGMGAAGEDPPSSVENIAAGRFPFLSAHSDGLRPPFHAPSYSSLPGELREYFQGSFVAGTRSPSARADAQTWVKALDRARATLKSCDHGHLYFAEAPQCPWCELAEARITCPKGHHYYRGEANCPRCRLEERRMARSSSAARRTNTPVTIAAPSPISTTPTSVLPVTAAPASASHTVPNTPSNPAPNVTLPSLKTLLRNPRAIRSSLAMLLLIAFVGANVWGPLHLLDRLTGRSNPLPLRKTPLGAFNPNDNAELILIPAGDFLMGDDEKYEGNGPIHPATLDAYYIYKTPVTVAQYLKFCKETGHAIPRTPDFNPNWSKSDHPIVNVSYIDALAYCDWAGVKLPTEAQWEKAASWDATRRVHRKYPWGDVFDTSKLQCSRVDFDAGGTKPVGSFPGGASPYGVLDMAGNVDQWCRDWSDHGFYISPESEKRNPDNQTVGDKDFRVLRGGSWETGNQTVFRTYQRYGLGPEYTAPGIGFRCAAGP